MADSDYAVGWGTLTLINAGLAQAKGRSGWNWWLVSILLGPIATFLIVYSPPVTPPPNPAPSAPAEERPAQT